MKLLKKNPRRIRLGQLLLRSIRLRDKAMFEEFAETCTYPNNLWSANFAYLWADSQSSRKRILWAIVDGMLLPFVLMKKSGLHLACLPFGKGEPDRLLYTVYQSLKFCHHWNRRNYFAPGTLRTLNAPQLEFLQQSKWFEKYFEYKQIKGLERHFAIPKLLQLSGSEFARVRTLLNKFKRENPQAIVRQYKQEDYEQLLEINENWLNTAGKKYGHIFDQVYFREIIQHQQALDHHVLVVAIDGQLVGLVTGGLTPEGQSWGCLIKKMADIKGLNEFMIIQFVQEIHRLDPNVQLLNIGSDLGVDGLATFKEKFRPALSLERYRLTLK